MSLQEQARESMAKERQHDEHLHESMLNRAHDEVDQLVEGETHEQARELAAQDRLHEQHLHQSMLDRATEQLEHS
ncbi:hypothetical protein VB834_21960 [Limnoraphis robusta Tam1]|jgi:hypothetical protein|uniref:Uncharacterized protein n=2 Tax=Limnoraphis robusta TaxID=1118279 RepID=A0A0F5YH72_9CYAN|nr:hypothetical protein [Limnoraphis robusta]MCG5058182.1 hypothetical protein [Limnoraphis sp. WC205]KKD38017.1 hypothetical protein WN50_11135 [Limnoraphis robusta CS-951]MEA5496626.1 hypothetical protein [Limnoraphis robusta BA-68 BA1]MEA5522923.1 hypothetical protein [Limnoraphis robusta CCNP1315]MEA5541697.1 hypothetical protein [Limnoraphis robusta Tam1]